MESKNKKEYRLEKYTGKIYTEREFFDHYLPAIGDGGVIGDAWDKMTVVPIEDGMDVEEVRAKLSWLYKGRRWYVGDIIINKKGEKAIVVETGLLGKIKVSQMGNLWQYEYWELEEEYLKLASATMSK